MALRLTIYWFKFPLNPTNRSVASAKRIIIAGGSKYSKSVCENPAGDKPSEISQFPDTAREPFCPDQPNARRIQKEGSDISKLRVGAMFSENRKLGGLESPPNRQFLRGE